MTDPKKILEKILKLVKNSGESDRVLKNMYPSLTTDQTLTKILKEFVHKDNLPSKGEIREEVCKYHFVGCDCPSKMIGQKCGLKHKAITQAIRKLIEGKK